jgi:molybdate transport system substrate-binding protein
MITQYLTRQLCSFALFLTICGCSSGHSDNPVNGLGADSTPIRIAAATDLQPWLGESLSQWCESQNPKIDVQVTYNASGKIAAQIRAGAPIDLFLSADLKITEDLMNEGLAEKNQVHPYAKGRLALIYEDRLTIGDWKDVVRLPIKHLAIANPKTAPYGRAAQSALVKSGLWPQLESKVVIGESVRQTMQMVVDGNAEAGIIALGHAKEAIVSHPNLKYVTIPSPDHDPIVQGLALIRHPDQSEKARNQARQIIGWVMDSANDPIFESHGLERQKP